MPTVESVENKKNKNLSFCPTINILFLIYYKVS